MTDRAVLLDALLTDPTRAADVSREAAAALVARLGVVQAALVARVVTTGTEGVREAGDRFLSPAEVARRLGVPVRWVYAHAHEIPGTHRLSRRCLRISERGLERYMARRKVDACDSVIS